MRPARRRYRLGAVAVFMLLAAHPVAAATGEGPALSVSEAQLAASLSCPGEFSRWRDPVLLVHGTATDSRDTWSQNYRHVLPKLGFSVCTVDLPDRSLGDIQIATEYVVHAVRTMAAASGRRVDLIGHSQGTLEIRWALRWWPDVRRLVDDAISLAGPHHGASGADQFCLSGSCAPAVHQMRPAALLYDAAVFALVFDALSHPGPADPARFDAATCAQPWMPGVAEPVTTNVVLYGPALMAVGAHRTVAEEPPLAPYAR